ncbi:hypothetical protein Pth03_79120 [Planotetraspora thailandica]|uniref:Tetracyclin repressor-like C-terminal domain-containing protein n=1 Tax=Planotetraspora thailandica TaxID=487172 RepID=A0A8J3Y275_9ACTN|nr:hypothetical protein Pth03_79120 [Planotetraspora thailandica]
MSSRGTGKDPSRLTARGAATRENALVAGPHDDEGTYRCPLGSPANELGGRSGSAHRLLAAAFDSWRDTLASGLARMQENGEVDPEVTAEELAVGVIAAIQGGYLLAGTTQDAQPFALALDMAPSSAKGHMRTDHQRLRVLDIPT